MIVFGLERGCAARTGLARHSPFLPYISPPSMEYVLESEGGQLVDEFKEPYVADGDGVPGRNAGGALPDGLQQIAAVPHSG